MELLLGILGIAVAVWQLNLQRQEIRRNGQITALVHVSTLLKDKIDFHNAIIESAKASNQSWTGHAKVINEELRPLRSKVQDELLRISADHNNSLPHGEIASALKFKSTTKQAGN